MQFKAFLRSSQLCESNDRAVKSLAKKLVGNSHGLIAARKIFNWVRDNVEWDLIDVVGARKLLKRRPLRAECADKNNLAIALYRATGIPARYILLNGKLKVKRKDLDVEIPHVASEVHVNGKWILADPSYGADTKKIIAECQFGKPIWKTASSISKMAELPKPMFPDGINNAIHHHPVALKYKMLLAKLHHKK